MLTPAQAILSALLTAIFVEFLTRRYGLNYENLELEPETIKSTNTNINLDIPVQRVEEPDEVNKLLDAIFVSHGIGIESKSEVYIDSDSTKSADATDNTDDTISSDIIESTNVTESDTPSENTKQIPTPYTPLPILELNESNFDSLFTGNWLILSHFLSHSPSTLYHDHFNNDYPTAVRNPLLKLATVDCNAHPMIAAALQVRSYPSLQLVTEDGRLREWPFELQKLDQRASWFLANSQWNYLPTYQLLRPLDASLALTAIQIAVFNKVHRFIGSGQPFVYDWVLNHRPLTTSILGLSFAAVLVGRKAHII